ncbi:hypothetical protein [Actinomadura rudentiformis]|uniref:Uncharacterized protein n=1 Tax=Actinomadura rudentiformis TaxID=359158 RepID=A0A6H9YEG3_9ACTN|nr:hypothetical protein [Actinomadura rudentiformis]KAB2343731.1 hypothetical protein F8566_33975 [Actinomadura rudentiformis]
MAIRVNAVGIDIFHDHEVAERGGDGALSVRYAAGPKAGLTVHFWAEDELRGCLIEAGFEPVLPIRAHSTRRRPPQSAQWETIFRRR